MNLAWLIYLGSVSGSASGFFTFLSTVGAFIALLGFGFSMLWSDSSRDEIRKKYEAIAQRGNGMWPRGLKMLIICGIISTLLPSQNTFYAMAAAQVGERVVGNEAIQGAASDSAKALQAWIKKQIEPDEKKK